MIYFARHESVGPVKIGYSTDIEKRIYRIGRQYRLPFTVVRTIPHGRRWGEIWLHRQFFSLRVRGEWFTFDPAMMTIELPDEAPGFITDYLKMGNVSGVHVSYPLEEEIHDLIVSMKVNVE